MIALTGKHRFWIILSAALSGAAFFYLGAPSKTMPGDLSSDLSSALATLDSISYRQHIKPILEHRCVVCHGCMDAPCQLKLSSIEGLQRGGSAERIYEPRRISNMAPTRLFIDAKTTAQWRQRGFYPVINEGAAGPKNNLKNSLLYHLLQLKKQHPQPQQGRLPDRFTLSLDREQSCPSLETVADFARQHPLWGMPYAMPNLSADEYRQIVSWLADGAPSEAAAGPSAMVLPQIDAWESFLNRTARKQRLVSRYLFEHLFHAHIHFAESPDREFYRLVRSRTPPGIRVDEIATLLPYDDPGEQPFFYRLLKYQPAIVAKNHIVYEFSAARMQRYRELFFAPDYSVSELPSYVPAVASNPFKVFSAIPAKVRYRFLLDDAYFFIEGFIKGPVCRGQIALDVIEDQFWVLFFDPDQSVITNNSRFIEEMSDDLKMPANGGSNLDLIRIWTDYWQGQRRYMESKQAWFKTIGTHDIDHAMGYIWDGDGVNPGAALTVFRHFDSGSVAYGLVGSEPETAWVIDYPLFERIHYLLVAGFNVFGNIGHRLSTRIYMDFLRMEGEDYFLAFLPASRRKAIRDSWYVGQRTRIAELFAAPQAWLSTDAVSGYRSDDPQHELYSHLKDRLSGVAGSARARNRCGRDACIARVEDSRRQGKVADLAMAQIARLRGRNAHVFPDVAFVRVRTDHPKEDLAYTLIRNKAYKNVTSFLADEHKRDLADIDRDSMTVVDWLEGSYPNFFFSVGFSELDEFVRRCTTLENDNDYRKFVDQYGVRRTNPDFWRLADWFQDSDRQMKPVSAGIFDLNRYQNR